MHPGNLFVAADGMIVGRRHGHRRRLRQKGNGVSLPKSSTAFITRDYLHVAEVHFEAGYVPRTTTLRALRRRSAPSGEPIHGQPAETISTAAADLLFEVTELFRHGDEARARDASEDHGRRRGRGAHAQPPLNMWKASEPVVGSGYA